MLTRLCISDHPVATWAGAVEPWLREHGAVWRETRVVLAPNSTWLAALKGSAVKAGLPVLGLHWLTPGRWRTLALQAVPSPTRRVALREDLHLLMELAAARLPNNPLAQSYGPDPAPFQELLDLLEGAGWSFDALPDPAARELAAEAAKLCAQTGWVTSATADRILNEAAAVGQLPKLGERLLAVGFSPADWAIRPLLQAASTVYGESELVFDVVDYNQTAAAAWVGVWEEKVGGTAEWLDAAEVHAPFAPWAAEILTPVPTPFGAQTKAASAVPTPQLWLADNLQSEADLVVAQALAFLSEAGDESPRVGIVVGSINSPLAREVAARLAALGLPHHDVPGHLPGRAPAQALFEAWLDWQENGRLDGLVSWVRVACQLNLISKKAAVRIENSLQKAAEATLSDDPIVLTAWLASVPFEACEVSIFLVEWPRLPESASWDDYAKKIFSIAKKLHWPEPPESLTERGEGWQKAPVAQVPRAAILRWVRAVTRVPGRTRAALGREAWAALQMVDAAGAAAQTWTHLVLGGLQHGEWPLDDRDSPLLEETTLPELNRRVLRQGPQGEGHWTVASNHGWLLSQVDRRRLDRAAFARLIGLPTIGLALTARRQDPADGRSARLSEYFWTVAKIVLGHMPTEGDWTSLAEISRNRQEVFLKFAIQKPTQIARKEKDLTPAPIPAETAIAHAARRNSAIAFDEYSFSLKTPPEKPLLLSCKAWEDAVKQPGASWFKHVLRIEPRWDPASDDYTRRSLGVWSHQWVQLGPAEAAESTTRESFPVPGFELWQKLASGRAQDIHAVVNAAFAAAGRPLPESWLDTWASAGRIALQWISALASQAEWPQALAEVRLPRDFRCLWPGLTTAIPLTGRMDLVLFQRTITFAPGQLEGVAAWLLDFKSGSSDKLKITDLAKGVGLQLALYAHALRALKASTVELTLLNHESDAEPQLSVLELDSPKLAGLWELLAGFATEGRWGEFHDLAGEYSKPGNYPTATLSVPKEILREKWNLTHPYFKK